MDTLDTVQNKKSATLGSHCARSHERKESNMAAEKCEQSIALHPALQQGL